jgi:hypothetical protein
MNFSKIKLITLVLFLLSLSQLNGQTWSGEVAQLFYNKCSKCHHPGGLAPTSLMTYGEVSPMATIISQYITDEEMPPWPPDNSYQEYLHVRSLSSTEKSTILNWLSNGLPEGNSAATPPPPVYTNNTILGNGDLTVQIPTYMSKATANDDYVCFSVPTYLTQNRIIKAVEVVPGNRQIVHHALIFIDPNGIEVTDTLDGLCASPSNASTKLVIGYTPGASPMILPSVSPLALGMDIGPGSKIYFAMHYPVGSYGEFDSTKVILHFYPPGTTNVRQISAAPLISNYNFTLPANQVTNLTAQYPTNDPTNGGVPTNFSVLSVFPHMHLLGTNIKAYAYKANQDTVKFVNIPHWDFHWQDFYFFRYIQKVSTGFKIKGEAKYDNTVNNPHNPNSPPLNVSSGFNTTDEMFLVYFHFMPYMNGDENYDLQELMSATLGDYMEEDLNGIVSYPNPFQENICIEFKDPFEISDQIFVYSSSGDFICKLDPIVGASKVLWDGKNSNGQNVSKGAYYLSARIKGKAYSKKLLKFD